jgi:hypothetical protein
MTIHWASLLAVFAVALGSTVAVVVLVTLTLVGLSAGPDSGSPLLGHQPPVPPQDWAGVTRR